MYTYFNDKLIDSTFRKKIYETDIEFIKKMKTETESVYSKHFILQ